MEEIESQNIEKEILTKPLYLGEEGSQEVEVEIEKQPDGTIRFTKDIKSPDGLPFLVNKTDLANSLMESGILEESGVEIEFADSDDHPGKIFIPKDVINNALEAGRIKISFDEDGDLQME